MHKVKRLRSALVVFFCLLAWGCGSSGGGDAPPATFTISGTVYAAAGNAVHTTSASTFETAQTLYPPVILGGFLNAGDPAHFFQVSLPVNATIRLALPDVPRDQALPQVELYLYRSDLMGEPVDQLRRISRTQALTVEVQGDYHIEVRALAGATIYRLVVDLPWARVGSAGLETDAEIVPGEVLVRLANVSGSASTRAMRDFARGTGLRVVQRTGNGWVRLRTEDVDQALTRLDPSSRRHAGADRSAAGAVRERRQDTLRIVRALRARPEVAGAEPNYIRRSFFEPNDPLYSLQWNLDLINLPAAWALTRGDAEVIVAVIDTGVLSAHPDLAGQLVPGYDFVSDDLNSGDGEPGIDPNPEDPGGSAGFHGSHVAGTVAAAFNNAIGVAGVGGATRILPVRALGLDGAGSDADIVNAIRWAAGLDVVIIDGEETRVIPGADPRADIINMSFGGPLPSQVLEDAVQAARAAGVILIAASGNQGANSNGHPAAGYPAGFAQVVSVGAVDAYARRAYYSNYGPQTIAAPGGNLLSDSQPNSYADGILSTVGRQEDGKIVYDYGFSQGTSMAAPHVSGVAALMKAVRPDMTPDEFDGFIVAGDITADLGPAGSDDLFGYGLIDAYAAVLRARASDPPPAHLTVTPAGLRLDAQTAEAHLFVRAVGNGDLKFTSIVRPQWVSAVEPDAGQAFGDAGRYRVTVDRQALAGGIHSGAITFISMLGSETRVPLTIDVLPDRRASAGTQYLLLIDAATRSTVAQLVLVPDSGEYVFSFTGVLPGSYYLFAGSDLNNDGFISDSGEAVGGYPSLEQELPIRVNANITGLQFVTGFNQWPLLWPNAAPRYARRAQ
jgi:serine protease